MSQWKIKIFVDFLSPVPAINIKVIIIIYMLLKSIHRLFHKRKKKSYIDIETIYKISSKSRKHMKTTKQHLGLHKVQSNAPRWVAGHTMDSDWFIESKPSAWASCLMTLTVWLWRSASIYELNTPKNTPLCPLFPIWPILHPSLFISENPALCFLIWWLRSDYYTISSSITGKT